MEKSEWKTFRNTLDESERKEFDEMRDIPKLYVSACSNSVQLVPLHPIILSILFPHYKELKEWICEVERTDEEANKANNNSSKKREWLTIKGGEEKQSEEEMPRPNNALDDYIILLE